MANMIDRRGTFIEDSARSYVKQLMENVDAFYANRATYKEFSATQRSIWDEIHDGVTRSQIDSDIETRVLELLRANLRDPGHKCPGVSCIRCN